MVDRANAGADGPLDALGAVRVRHHPPPEIGRGLDDRAHLGLGEVRLARVVGRREEPAGRRDLDHVGAGADRLAHLRRHAVDAVADAVDHPGVVRAPRAARRRSAARGRCGHRSSRAWSPRPASAARRRVLARPRPHPGVGAARVAHRRDAERDASGGGSRSSGRSGARTARSSPGPRRSPRSASRGGRACRTTPAAAPCPSSRRPRPRRARFRPRRSGRPRSRHRPRRAAPPSRRTPVPPREHRPRHVAPPRTPRTTSRRAGREPTLPRTAVRKTGDPRMDIRLDPRGRGAEGPRPRVLRAGPHPARGRVRGARRPDPREPRRRARRRCSSTGSRRSTTRSPTAARGTTPSSRCSSRRSGAGRPGALWDIPWRPSIPLAVATEAQKDEYLRPGVPRRASRRLRDHRGGRRLGPVDGRDHGDPRRRRLGAERRRSGTSPRATSPTSSSCTRTSTATPRRRPSSSSTRTCPACALVRTPKYMHTFVFEHPIFALEDVRVGDGQGARRGRAGLRAHEGLVRRGAAHDRRSDGRRGDPRARPLARVRDEPCAVRATDRRVPGDRVHARRHGRRDHGREVDALPRRVGGGSRRHAAQGASTRSRAR